MFYQSVTRSAFVQNIIVSTLGFIFYSFWVPQIVRNVFRGCRHPLSHRYIFVMSITRLSVPLYFYGCPDNIIGHETTPWVWLLVGYIALQVVILLLQDAFGPRFFVPSKVSFYIISLFFFKAKKLLSSTYLKPIIITQYFLRMMKKLYQMGMKMLILNQIFSLETALFVCYQ